MLPNPIAATLLFFILLHYFGSKKLSEALVEPAYHRVITIQVIMTIVFYFTVR